jgi:hypothetical protein
MHHVSQKTQSLELALKATALLCGVALLVASIYPDDSPFKNTDPGQFVQDQFALLAQLKWLIGVLLIVISLLYKPQKLHSDTGYAGDRDLSQDGYKLYLLTKYNIERNSVLDQITCRNRLFSNVAEALSFAHQIECPSKTTLPLDFVKPGSVLEPVKENLTPIAPIETALSEASSIKAADARLVMQPPKKNNRLPIVFMLLLLVVIVGGIYYAKTQGKNEEVPLIASPITPLNSDQVLPNSAPAIPAPSAETSAESAVKIAAVPINERWIGTWAATDNKLKLVITAANFKYGNDDFSWVGVRPKGVIQCCPAFYEGSTSKADLLERIQRQAPNAGAQTDQQNTLEMIKALSEGNFKRIVLADPLVRKYFFIYDQQFVYRINRDLGDNANVVLEQFKRQE